MKTLDWTKPVTTRGGSEVKIYEVFYPRYCNGAYYDPDDDVWYPCQWGPNGMYGDRNCAIDLVNTR